MHAGNSNLLPARPTAATTLFEPSWLFVSHSSIFVQVRKVWFGSHFVLNSTENTKIQHIIAISGQQKSFLKQPDVKRRLHGPSKKNRKEVTAKKNQEGSN